MGKLKVLLVVGDLEMRRHLAGILDADMDLEIVAEANNAYTARDKIIECEPDVMLLCHDLPRMSGITFLEKLMPQRSTATLVIAEPQYEEAAFHAGARDFIACGKNSALLEQENICNRLKKLAGGEWLKAIKKVACADVDTDVKKCQQSRIGDTCYSDVDYSNRGVDRGHRSNCRSGAKLKKGYSRNCNGAAYAGGLHADVCSPPGQ